MKTSENDQEHLHGVPGDAAADEIAQLVTKIVSAITDCFTSIDESSRARCSSYAAEIALSASTLFAPKHVGAAELRWCGPDGQPAPVSSFPRDFIDRRTTVSWSLYRMTVTTPVDEPIFSAQARVTMHHEGLATFKNFDKPAAIIISSLGGSLDPQAHQLPEPIRQELAKSMSPLVYVVMDQLSGFEDVILYTSLCNFSRAFAAFQTGPWRALKQPLAASEQLFAESSFSFSERRAVQRASLAAIEMAWESIYRLPLGVMQSTLLSVLTRVSTQIKA